MVDFLISAESIQEKNSFFEELETAGPYKCKIFDTDPDFILGKFLESKVHCMNRVSNFELFNSS